MSAETAEAVCMLTGAPPTEANVSDVQAAWRLPLGGWLRAAAGAAAEAPAGAEGTGAAEVDEINCLLSGMPPVAANVAHCEDARLGAPVANASFGVSSAASAVSDIDEVACLLNGMPPTELNVQLAEERRSAAAPAQPSSGFLSFGSSSAPMQSIPRRAVSSIPVRRVASLMAPI